MKIAFMSDTHLAAVAKDFTANCETAMAWIDGLGADLVVHLGDITADGVHGLEQLPFARQVLDGLRTPLSLIPGNHDIGNNPIPGFDPSEPLVQPSLLALYRTTFGPDRWAKTMGKWTLIGLNALILGLGDDEEEAQFAWLDDVLSNAAGPVGLMLHKPLFRTSPDDDERHTRYIPNPVRARLLNRFVKNDLQFVICGHTHQLRRTRFAGVEHVWVPSTAFILPDSLQEPIGEKVVGVMVLTLTPQQHHFEFHTPPGMTAHNIEDYDTVFPGIRKMRDAGPFKTGYR
jgi:3',5'-cyclic AMP phosphodiesterase CpdA